MNMFLCTGTVRRTDINFNITCHVRNGADGRGKRGRLRLARRKLSHSRLYIKKEKVRQFFREENNFFKSGTDKQTLTYISQEGGG